MSTKHIYEIGDSDGNSFKISIVVPFIHSSGGSWRAIDKGFIRYISGKTNPWGNNTWNNDQNLQLLSSDETSGMQLDIYRDAFGLNDEGTGEVVQPWVLSLKPGKITWNLLE